MRIFSWNVNGLRAVLNKGALQEFITKEQPDILCLQETKAKPGQAEVDLPQYQDLLGDGSDLGISFKYEVQYKPGGLAEAFLIGEDFIGDDNVALILGDNIFHGHRFTEILKRATNVEEGAVIFGYYTNNPEDFGVVEFDDNGKAVSIEEKPNNPKSNYAVVGIYFYPNEVINIAKTIKPSKPLILFHQSFLNAYAAPSTHGISIRFSCGLFLVLSYDQACLKQRSLFQSKLIVAPKPDERFLPSSFSYVPSSFLCITTVFAVGICAGSSSC